MGVLVPAGTPHEIVARLHREIIGIIAQPDMTALGYEPVANTPEQFCEDIRAEINNWAKVIEAANLKVQ